MLTKTQFSDSIDLFMLSICLVSFIFELSLLANEYNVFSTNIESFSTTVLQPLVITRTELSDWIIDCRIAFYLLHKFVIL